MVVSPRSSGLSAIRAFSSTETLIGLIPSAACRALPGTVLPLVFVHFNP
jgi:hypothetical protein